MNKTTCCIALLTTVCALAGKSYATPIFFSVDPNQSSLSIDVQSLFGSAAEQTPGSWETSYFGGLVADVTSSTIQILPTSTLVAGVSAVASPAPIYPTTDPAEERAENDLGYVNSSSPANYGTVTNLTPIGGPAVSNSATRDLQLSLADAAPKPLVGGAFSEAGIQPDFLSGIVWLTYGNASFSGPFTDLSGDGIAVSETADTLGQGTLVRSGDLLTLTLPLEFTESHFGSSTTYSGTIVATANVPEPMAAILLLPAATLLTRVRSRR